jgi:uncharacterized protein (TIGR02722 family)
MKKRLYWVGLICLLGLLASGCKTKVDRLETDKVVDLSGRWNDTDSQLVSAEMINDLQSKPWMSTFTQKTGRVPVILVGPIRNKSSEHIETGTFTKDLERELINSGKVRFVADSQERAALRAERREQQTWSREETQKRLAAETGADFMLQGSIKTIMDQEGKKSVKFYQVDLELIHLETNEKVWIGSKKIKKLVKRARYRW